MNNTWLKVLLNKVKEAFFVKKNIAETGENREDAFYEDISVQIFNRSIENTSFYVYGLSGKWGSGKTAFIQFGKEYIKENMMTGGSDRSIVFIPTY